MTHAQKLWRNLFGPTRADLKDRIASMEADAEKALIALESEGEDGIHIARSFLYRIRTPGPLPYWHFGWD